MHLCSLPLCQFLSISVSLTLSFAQKCFHEPFQSILHTSWPLTPMYLGMYFQEYISFLCSHSSLFCPLIRLCKYPQVRSVQFSRSVVCPTLCDPMNRSTPGLPVHQQLPEFTQTHVHRVSDAIQPSHPLSSPSPPAPNPSSIRVFSNESTLCMRWPKYWRFSFSISPSNEQPSLISFRMDWLDLLAVQGTLKSLLQHHNSKAPVLWHSAFFTVQLSHPYMTTGKTIALTRQTKYPTTHQNSPQI